MLKMKDKLNDIFTKHCKEHGLSPKEVQCAPINEAIFNCLKELFNYSHLTQFEILREYGFISRKRKAQLDKYTFFKFKNKQR